MNCLLVTRDDSMKEAAARALPGVDEFQCFEEWSNALEACAEADVLYIDLRATLDQPHKIAGYERFAEAKLSHPTAKAVPTVLLAPPPDYDLDFMTGYPGLISLHLPHPITEKSFRLASALL